VVEAEIQSSRTWRVWHKPKNSSGYWVHHFEVTARDGDGETLVDECSRGYYESIKSGQATLAPFLKIGPFQQLGRAATQSSSKLVWFGILAFAYFIICAAVVSSLRPWWLRKKIIDSAGGRLSRETVNLK
jgi:hypothetical protein